MDLPCSGSGMIHLNCESPVNSSMGDRASGCRRRDLEKNRIRAEKLASACLPVVGKLTLSELSVHLSPQDMEQVGGGRHVSNLHVTVLMLTVKLVRRREDSGILVAELKIPLHTTRRMLRTLSIITMR